MANTNSPNGLVPFRHLSGGSIRASAYSIASAYAYSIYEGNPVEMTGTGRNVQNAAAGNADNIGVFAGVRYVDAQGNQVFSKKWPADTVATDIIAYVYDDPNIVFAAQCDTLAEGDVGTLVDWNEGTGNDTTGISGAYADVGAGTATTAQSLRIQRLIPRVNNAYGAYAKAEVTFAEHALKTGAAGAGGV